MILFAFGIAWSGRSDFDWLTDSGEVFLTCVGLILSCMTFTSWNGEFAHGG